MGYLTNEGIQYLRDYLHLPPEIVPSTLKRQAPRETRPRASAAPRAGGDKGEGDRAAYRRAPGAGETDKAGAAGPGSAPMEFRGGLCRDFICVAHPQVGLQALTQLKLEGKGFSCFQF